MEDDTAPDRATTVIRFACGFIFFGGTALLFLGVNFTSLSGHTLLLSAASFGVVAGVLAVRFGDVFWLKMRDFFP